MSKPTISIIVSGVVICLVLFFSLTLAQTPPPGSSCRDNWSSKTETEREQCVEREGGLLAFNATTDAMIQHTVLAAPTVDSTAERATEAAAYAAAGRPTGVPTITPGVSPQDTEIRRIEPQEVAGGPNSIQYKYRASVWVAGAVVDAQGYGKSLYVTTPREECAVYTVIPNYTPGVEQYDLSWSCPQNIGEIIITDITVQDGVATAADELNHLITATDDFSRTITFDLGTEEWTLEGQPWLPETTPTP